MNFKNLRESLRLNEQFSLVFCHLLVAVMMVCLMVTVADFGQRLDTNWQGGYLPLAAFVVTLEAMFTQRRTRVLAPLSGEWLAFRLAEVVLLVLGLKALLYLVRGPAQLLADLVLWQQDFLNTFFQGEYLLACLLVLFIWFASGQFADDLAEMTGDEILLEDEIPPGIASERMNARQSLVDRVFFIGIVMVALTGLARLDLRLLWGSRPPAQGSIVNVLVYFLAGLALLSQTQFAILRASWTWERIPLSRNLGPRWTAYGLAFLALIAGLALILPTDYTLGLLEVLGYLVNWFVYIVMTLIALFMLLLGGLLGLFGLGKGGQQSQAIRDLPPPPLPETVLPPTTSPWLEVLKSVGFWVIFGGIVLFSIYQYLNQNKDLLAQLRRLPAMVWLEKAWQWLRGWVQGANTILTTAVATGLRRLRQGRAGRAGAEAWDYLNLRRLSPRERVLFFYLALVRRGADSGLPRRASQTPSEYEYRLKQELPDSAADLEGVTQAFIAARYSRRPVTPEQAGQVKRSWEQLRTALQRLRRARKGD